MKVLLLDEETRLYYGGQKSWVPQTSEAVNFAVIEAAAAEAQQWQKHSLAIVLRYDNPEFELALNPAFCMPTRTRPSMTV